MKKIISATLLAALSLFSVTAVQAQDAKKIMQDVSSKYGKLKSLKGDFVLKYTTASGKAGEAVKGNLALKGSKYKVTLKSQTIITDAKSIWTYNKSANEVQIDKYNANSSFSPAKLFSGSYDKEYNYKLAGETTYNGKSSYTIELTPKAAGGFSKINLYVDKTKKSIVGGKVFEKTGNVIEYTVNSLVENPGIADSEFTFDPQKHPGVEVIDLR